jgi:hypothetical protein
MKFTDAVVQDGLVNVPGCHSGPFQYVLLSLCLCPQQTMCREGTASLSAINASQVPGVEHVKRPIRNKKVLGGGATLVPFLGPNTGHPLLTFLPPRISG